jgi:hypothetical protein
MDFEVWNRTTRVYGWLVDFCLVFGSGDNGMCSVSAERIKNGACDDGFKVGYFGWIG